MNPATNFYHNTPLLLTQPSGTRFFGKKGQNCLSSEAASFFVRPKNRVKRGKFAKQTCNRSRLSFAHFSLAKQKKVSAPSARDAWLKLHGYLIKQPHP